MAKKRDIVRLWKDEKYRKKHLTKAELKQFESEAAFLPAGIVELSDADLKRAALSFGPDSRNCSISTSWCSKTWCEKNQTCPKSTKPGGGTVIG